MSSDITTTATTGEMDGEGIMTDTSSGGSGSGKRITKALKAQKKSGGGREQKEGMTEEEKLQKKKDRKERMKELREKQQKKVIEKRFLPRSEVETLLPKLCEKQDFKFRSTEIRNVLLVGRSRTGKTTVVRTLRGVENVIKPLTIFSETKNVNFRSFSLQGQNELDYTFNIIDTPGLFEVKRIGQRARTDQEIINMISDCLKNEITKIHAIILFCSLNNGVNDTDVAAMKKLIECFGTETNIAICVTRAENMDTEAREKLKKELHDHGEMGPLLEQVDENVFFMGAIDPDRMVNEEFLDKSVTTVMEDRQNFLDFLFLCDNQTRIENLHFVNAKRDEIKKQIMDKLRLVNDLLSRDLSKDEKIFHLAKMTGMEVDNFKHMVSLFDAACLEQYSKLIKITDKLWEKIEASAPKLDG